MRIMLTFILLSFLFCCNRQNKELPSELPVIDLNKEYPAKRIDIHELADIEYIPLETTENSLISQGGVPRTIGDSSIVVFDIVQRCFFFFDRNGHFLFSVNRFGQGAEEYYMAMAFAVDFANHELFVYEHSPQRIQVYSFSGEFKRKLGALNTSKAEFRMIYEYDENFLIAFNDSYWPSPNDKYRREADLTPYYLIDKQTGEMRSVDTRLTLQQPVHRVFKMGKGKAGYYNMPEGISFPRMLKNGSEFLLFNNALDTLFSSMNNKLIPIAVRTPSALTMAPPVLIAPLFFNDDYFIYRKIPMDYELAKEKGFDERGYPAYILYRKTNEIYQLQLYDSLLDPETNIEGYPIWTAFPNNGYFSMYSENMATAHYRATFLLEYLEKGTLRGKLKEVASQLKEDDNYITIIYNFK